MEINTFIHFITYTTFEKSEISREPRLKFYFGITLDSFLKFSPRGDSADAMVETFTLIQNF